MIDTSEFNNIDKGSKGVIIVRFIISISKRKPIIRFNETNTILTPLNNGFILKVLKL